MHLHVNSGLSLHNSNFQGESEIVRVIERFELWCDSSYGAIRVMERFELWSDSSYGAIRVMERENSLMYLQRTKNIVKEIFEL